MTASRTQPGSREAIAKAIYASWLDAGHCAENHFQWFDAGKDNPDSCVHYSNVAKAIKAADAVLAAVPQLGVQTEEVRRKLRIVQGAVHLLRKAIHAGDPRTEIDLRCHDIWTDLEAVAALSIPDDSDLQAAHQRIQELQGENDRLSSLLPSADSRGGK